MDRNNLGAPRRNSHPTQLDRKHHEKPRERDRELSSYAPQQKPPRDTKRELSSYTPRQKPPRGTQRELSSYASRQKPPRKTQRALSSYTPSEKPPRPTQGGGVLARILRNVPASLTGIFVYLGGRSAGERANYRYEADSHHPGLSRGCIVRERWAADTHTPVTVSTARPAPVRTC